MPDGFAMNGMQEARVRVPLAPQLRRYIDLDEDHRTAKLTAKFMIAG